jgi:hypothetical protein
MPTTMLLHTRPARGPCPHSLMHSKNILRVTRTSVVPTLGTVDGGCVTCRVLTYVGVRRVRVATVI